MEQEVYHINTEIYDVIAGAIDAANNEILVATAWFTDRALFDILKQKALSGIKVGVIVADNENNSILPFNELVSAGAEVLKVKNVGYGMMHQKFCAIDKREVIFGSYNWTVNARKNNHESIIKSDDPKTVDRFIFIFNEIKDKAKQLESKPAGMFDKLKGKFFGKNGKNGSGQAEIELDNDSPEVHKPETPVEDFARILDAMIASEISGYDREMLYNQGYDRALTNNGNHEILPKSLDSLYSSFINDIHVVEDKKTRLLAKIEEQKIKKSNQIDADHQIETHMLEANSHATLVILETEITALETEKGKVEQEIESVKNNRIKPLEEQIKSAEGKIEEANKSFVQPTINWTASIFLVLGMVVLGAYIFLFYSSASYILLYTELDAAIALRDGIVLNPPEVFNHGAIKMAFDKGGTAPFIVLAFPLIPIFLAMGKKIVKSKFWGQFISIVLGMLVVDSFVAYKVAEAIHKSEYLSGIVDESWERGMVLDDSNFYLVFIMGAFGILLFKVVFEKFVTLLEDRNPDVDSRKKLAMVKKIEQKIGSLKESIVKYNLEVDQSKIRIKEIEGDLVIKRSKLSALPDELITETKRLDLSKNAKENEIERISDLYRSHVENDNLPISVDAMKDRISVFLNGWNKFLHEEYSITKAIEMSSKAMVFSNEWLSAKVQSQGRENIFKVKS
jgi:hypothetical protein